MKRNVGLIYFISFFLFIPQISALAQDQQRRERLIELKGNIERITTENLEENLNLFYENSDILGNAIGAFEKPYNENEQAIIAKYQEKNQSPNPENTFEIEGRVMDSRDGVSLVDLRDQKIALKGTYRVGQSFNGMARFLGSTVTFNSPVNDYSSLNLFEPVPGKNSTEDLTRIENEIKNLKYSNSVLLSKFISESLDIVNFSIRECEEKIMDSYYKDAENYQSQGFYEKELSEYRQIQSYNPDYLDVKKRIETAIKEIKYIEAANFAGKKKYLEAYTVYFHLAYPESFKESFNLFKENFTNYLSEKMGAAGSAKDFHQYLSLFDSIDIKGVQSGDKGTFDRIKASFTPGFKEFVMDYYNPERTPDLYNIIPEGSFEGGLEEESNTSVIVGRIQSIVSTLSDDESPDVEGFLMSKTPINYSLLQSYKIIEDPSLNLDFSKSSSFETMKIPVDLKKKVIQWINAEQMTVNDIIFVNCLGFESLKEKDEILNQTKRKYSTAKFLKGFVDYANYYKIRFEKIPNDDFRDQIEDKADKIMDEIEEEVDKIKD